MNFAEEWADVWNKSIQGFNRAKRGLIPQLEDVVGGTGALVKSLAAIDKHDPEKAKAPDRKKALTASEKEFKSFKKHKTAYGKTVDAAIKATSKANHPEVYRELKVIAAHLDWVDTAIANRLTTMGKDSQDMNDKVSAKIEKKREELREGGATDLEVRTATQMLQFSKLLVTFPTAAKTGSAVALKAIQTIKANPTAAVYNVEMDHGGRNYTQQMNNVINLARHADCPPDLAELVQGLIPYDAQLREYGGGDKRTVPQDATPETVVRLTKEYSQLVKATIGYVDVVTKYIAKNKKKLGLK